MVLAAGAANADFFSFASGGNPDGPTFRGGPGSVPFGVISDGSSLDLGGSVTVDFLWDQDEDGPGAAVVIPSTFTLTATSGTYQTTSFAGQVIHNFTMSGNYTFRRQSDNAVVMTVNFANALFTSWSTSTAELGQTATLISNIDVDPTLTFTAGPALGSAAFTQSPDFAFTLTALRDNNGGRAGTTPNGGFAEAWRSEGSWSAQAIPAPGALALAGIAMVSVARRRR